MKQKNENGVHYMQDVVEGRVKDYPEADIALRADDRVSTSVVGCGVDFALVVLCT